METKRLFLAIKIVAGPELNRVYTVLKEGLRHERINWVKPDNLHFTLKFFGETPLSEIDPIISSITKYVKTKTIFDLELEDIGVFGSRYEPRVIWIGIKKSSLLPEMVKTLNEQLAVIGYRTDRQNFIPHLTIARIKNLKDIQLFQQIIAAYSQSKFQSYKVDKIILYESILQRSGPLYRIIKEFPLMA